WNGAVNTARDKRSALASTATGATIVSLHSEWVDKLHAVRSQIIHERIRLGDGRRTITFEQDAVVSTLSFQLPPQIAKQLPFLRRSDEAGDIVSGSTAIADKGIEAATLVMTALQTDLLGRTGAPEPSATE